MARYDVGPPVLAPPPQPVPAARARWPVWVVTAVLVAVIALAVSLVFLLRGGSTVSGVGSALRPTAKPSTFPSSQSASSTTSAPPAQSRVLVTTAGRLAIEGVSLTSHYPVECQAGETNCLTSSGNRILVVTVHSAPGQISDETVRAIANEAFDSYVVLPDGTRVNLRLIYNTNGTHSLSLVYAYLPAPVAPSSITLQWPNSPGVVLR